MASTSSKIRISINSSSKVLKASPAKALAQTWTNGINRCGLLLEDILQYWDHSFGAWSHHEDIRSLQLDISSGFRVDGTTCEPPLGDCAIYPQFTTQSTVVPATFINTGSSDNHVSRAFHIENHGVPSAVVHYSEGADSGVQASNKRLWKGMFLLNTTNFKQHQLWKFHFTGDLLVGLGTADVLQHSPSGFSRWPGPWPAAAGAGAAHCRGHRRAHRCTWAAVRKESWYWKCS